jgi:hypothetical protein
MPEICDNLLDITPFYPSNNEKATSVWRDIDALSY